jgi:D-alanyl-D-alanine carboxypeptidase (penicillin-binding protein 5/6)
LASSVRRAAAHALFALCLLAAPAAHAAKGFAPSKFAAISIDATTGQVLYERKADARRYPASLTKVMTLYLAFDEIEAGRLRMSDRIRISPHAAAQAPTKLGLRAGSTIRVRDALNVIVVKSANDLAVALAEKIAGTESKFVARMNRKAKALGMRHTHFANASGLPNSRNVSTARDLATLARAMVRDHPKQYALFDQPQTRYRGRVIHGHNRLITHPGIDGVKTGYIRASGFNLITSGVRDGHRVIAVVLGGSTAATRDRYMGRLMTASFEAEAEPHADKAALVAEILSGRSLAEARRLTVHETMADAVRKAADEPMDGAETAEAGAGDAGSEWRVQVGAFSTRAASSERLAEISRRHPDLFDADDARVKPTGDLYVARFVAASEREAEKACAVLSREGADCLALQHTE